MARTTIDIDTTQIGRLAKELEGFEKEEPSDNDTTKKPLEEDTSENYGTAAEDNLDNIEIKFDPGEYVQSAKNKRDRK